MGRASGQVAGCYTGWHPKFEYHILVLPKLEYHRPKWNYVVLFYSKRYMRLSYIIGTTRRLINNTFSHL